MKEAFELAAIGEHSGRQILAIMEVRGLRSRNGGPVSHGNLMKLLRNPFYAGRFRFDGIEYSGTHEPLIWEELFRRAGDIAWWALQN